MSIGKDKARRTADESINSTAKMMSTIYRNAQIHETIQHIANTTFHLRTGAEVEKVHVLHRLLIGKTQNVGRKLGRGNQLRTTALMNNKNPSSAVAVVVADNFGKNFRFLYTILSRTQRHVRQRLPQVCYVLNELHNLCSSDTFRRTSTISHSSVPHSPFGEYATVSAFYLKLVNFPLIWTSVMVSA